MRPSVGRIVHYVGGRGNCLAAIITDVGAYPADVSDADKDNIAVPVSLHVFVAAGEPESWHGTERVRVMQSELTHDADTWHWPERV